MIDTPPVLSVTDPVIVARLVDGVVYVAAYNKTRKDDSREGLRILRSNNVNVIGGVLANIDVRKTKHYGYHGYYYYGSDDKQTGR